MERPGSYTAAVAAEAIEEEERERGRGRGRRGPGAASTSARRDDEGRTWAERNKPVSVRLREEDVERLAAAGQRLGMSKDQVGRALMWAALDALESGLLSLETEDVQTVVEDKLWRTRIYVRREARPSWQSSTLPLTSDSGGT